MKITLIAEAGVNNNGRLDTALKLCDAAKAAGADIVKFQTFKAENIIISDVPMAAYQMKNLKSKISQIEMLRKLQTPYEYFPKILKHCQKIGIGFLSTPTDQESLDLLISMGLKTIKIASAEVSNILFLRQVGQKKAHVILSTGMSTLPEVRRAYKELIQSGAKSVSLLHCTTNYPCAFEDVNLKAINTLRQQFKTTVGYSDHTPGIEIAVAAAGMGAQIIEKHFTLDKTMPGPDHKASLEPKEFKMLSNAIRHIELAMGDGIKSPRAVELGNRHLMRRSIVAARPIQKGEIFSIENLAVKRAAGGMLGSEWDRVAGKKAKRSFVTDEIIVL